MTEYQITMWRDLPSMVTARDGDDIAKVQLAARFQAAIDEAAMRLGATGAEAYLDGWTRGDWTTGDGTPAELAATISAALETEWSQERLNQFLDGLG